MELREHWRKVYGTRRPDEVSWYQPAATPSLAALDRLGADKTMSLVDVGGGASTLVDALLEQGWTDVTVVDVAEPALEASRARIGAGAKRVSWVVADIRTWRPGRAFDIWHDRAAFHFLTDAEDRAAYRRALLEGTHAGSRVVLATFASDGPDKCSGLPVRRYDAEGLAEALGPEFEPAGDWRETHVTPWGAEQRFQWCLFTRK